jgi:hypothetical protein
MYCREFALEQLEERIVLDAAVIDTHDVQDSASGGSQVDTLGWIFVGNGWWYNNDGAGWWYNQNSGWWWNQNTDWWYMNASGFDWWYHGSHEYFANEHSTGAWFWYDDTDDFKWEPVGRWFYSSDGYWEWSDFSNHVYLSWSDYSYSFDYYYLYNELTYSNLASWYMYPGSDNWWSGGALSVAVADNSDSWMVRALDYAKLDVVCMDFTFEWDSFSEIVNSIGWVSWFYGATIDYLAILGHGYTSGDGMCIGDWITTDNYWYFYSDFMRLSSYMDYYGQIQLYHCYVGQAWDMLDDIAGWTTTDIFANTDSTVYHYPTGSYWVSDGDDSALTFEYKSYYYANYVDLFTWDYY